MLLHSTQQITEQQSAVHYCFTALVCILLELKAAKAIHNALPSRLSLCLIMTVFLCLGCARRSGMMSCLAIVVSGLQVWDVMFDLATWTVASVVASGHHDDDNSGGWSTQTK